MDDLKVEIACFDRRHSFAAARAAAEAGYLRKFYTTVFVNRSQQPYRALVPILRGPLAGAGTRLLQHECPSLDPSLVEDFPMLGLALKGVTGLRSLSGSQISEALNVAGSIAFDRRVLRRLHPDSSIFHAFARYSADSIAAAKGHGIAVLLDQPEPHVDYMIAASEEERQSEGVPLGSRHPFADLDIRRRRQEVATADFVLVGLDFVRRTVIDAGYPPERIFLVPYGVTLPSGSLQPVSSRARSDVFRLLFVGALSWVKGLHRLLDTLERVPIPQLELRVIGRAHDKWGIRLKERMAKDPRIRWIPGLPRSELFQEYRKADALVFPSLVGGIGLVVYEAMSCGLPVVVSDGDVVIREGVDGLVAHPDVPGALERALSTLAEDAQLRGRLARQGSERVREFSWDAYMDGIQRVYETIARIKERDGLTPIQLQGSPPDDIGWRRG